MHHGTLGRIHPIFNALFAILDPFAEVPIFLALTKNYSASESGGIANISTVTVLLDIAPAILSGETILQTTETSLAPFRVDGGILLVLMALAMLNGQTGSVRTTPEEKAEVEDEKTSTAIVLAA